MDADLFEDQTYLHDSDFIDRLFAAKLETEIDALRVEQGWPWAKSTTDTWVPHAMYKDLISIYPTEVELPEADQAEYEALSERRLSENDKLSTDEQQRLDGLQTRADDYFTDEDREVGGSLPGSTTKAFSQLIRPIANHPGPKMVTIRAPAPPPSPR